VAAKASSNWWELAACREADPEFFFPISGAGASAADVARAKAYCARCCIRQRCLDFAIDSHEVHGVWGGTSEEERRVIAARRGELERLPG
jgi:WhiB family transcriptional regulator, redox-sensing transcriptional regulator